MKKTIIPQLTYILEGLYLLIFILEFVFGISADCPKIVTDTIENYGDIMFLTIGINFIVGNLAIGMQCLTEIYYKYEMYLGDPD